MSDMTPEENDREDLVGVFVVEFDPGLYGPFQTRRLAREWAEETVAVHGDPAVTYSWTVCPVITPAGGFSDVSRG